MELYLYDESVTPIFGPIEDMLSLSYTECFLRTGEYTFTLPISYADVIDRAAYMELRGEGAPTPFIDGRKTLGRVEKTVYDGESSLITVSGRLAESLLSDRFIPRGTYVSGTVREVIVEILNKNVLSPFAGERSIAHLRTETLPEFLDENGALILIEQHLGGNVLEDWLRELLASYGASYRITYEESEALEPLVFSVYFAEDRTQAQSEHSPVIFSTSLATLENATLVHDTTLYKNYVFIAGEGSGEDRVTLTLDFRESDDEPLRELYLDARDLRSDDGWEQLTDAAYLEMLTARAKKRLMQYADITRIEGTGTPSVSLPLAGSGQLTLRAGTDFSLGDLCELSLDAPPLTLSERVTALRTELVGGVAVTQAIFGAEHPSLWDLLRP